MNGIFWIGGAKGGVGKSAVSMAPPYYSWTAWAMGNTPEEKSCDRFWNSALGIWSSWGYGQSPHSYYAPGDLSP